MIDFIKYKNIFFVLTLLMIAGSVAAIAIYGLRPGIEFTGGNVLEIEYDGQRPDISQVREIIAGLSLKEAAIYEIGERGMMIRTENLDSKKQAELSSAIGQAGEFQERSFEAVGPMVGKELTNKMAALVLISLAAMLLYIAVAFRNVPGPVNSWQYGIASFLILCHDVLVPLGVFAVLGAFGGVQITIPIITALLIVVGYAINNVIVVYDRVRENLMREHKASFAENVNRAINQTLSRQINTSLATLLPVFAIYFWGGESLKYFSLALILGIGIGTYSSVFLAGQALVFWRELKLRR